MAEIVIKTQENFKGKIYAYTTPGVTYHEGWLKIGYTEQDVETRIKQQTHTAGINYIIQWVIGAPCNIKDTDFHRYLIDKYKIPRDKKYIEWFKIDPNVAKKYLEEFNLGKTKNKIEIICQSYDLRTEQQQAVDITKKYFEDGTKPREFLWNAKPRFGKTLTAYDFILQIGAQKVLIVTNRPSIANSWFDDFKTFISWREENYKFVSKTDALKNQEILSREEFIKLFDSDTSDNKPRMIAFVSLQDLKGSKHFGGTGKEKLDWIKDLEFDLLIVDEAHEGVDTHRTEEAFKNIKRNFTLYLSGTPFKALANDKFREDQIFNWSYEDEQAAKNNWGAEFANPYSDLPKMNLFSYQLSKIILDKINAGIAFNDENFDYAFDLNELFRTENSKFIYEDKVKKFLDALTKNKKFPFTAEFRAELKHTFWLMYRVDSIKAMAKLLKEHEIFSEYEIVIAAGDGKVDESDEKLNQKSLAKVRDAIANHDKTITLSVGQLTTGVTVPEWTAVLMLSNIQSAAEYMQAAFRAQNPYVHQIGDKTFRKTNCYIFDFAPERTLKIYDQFANNLKTGGGSRRENIEKLKNFFPVLAEDDNGEMIELDAEKIISLPQIITAQKVVDTGFMSNELFANITHVFGAPQSVVAVIEKFIPDDTPENKKIKINAEDIKGVQVDSDGNVIINKTEAHLGKKSKRDKKPVAQDVKEIAAEITENLKAAGYDINKNVTKKIESRLKNDTSEENIDKVEQEIINLLETKKANAKKESIEAKIRAHLRGFARTVPSFIMAYGNRNLTLANFETYIDDETFKDVTGIDKADFRFLRDGGVRNGENFAGHLFDEEIFNAAVQEFLNRKDELADYFDESHDKDIFDYIPPQKTSQIFTPRFIVKAMVDALAAESPNIFCNPNQIFIDPYMKSGMYITEIVKRLFKNLRADFASDADCLRHILENQVYGFAPNEIIYRIATEYIFGRHKDIQRRNFFRRDLTDVVQTGDATDFLKKNFVIKVIILNKERVKKFGEVFTPTDIVNRMLDDENLAEIWQDIDAKILEPTAGEGAFLVPILLRKLALAKNPNDMFHALASIYAIEIQPDNLEIAKQTLREIFIAWHEEKFGTFDEDTFGEFVDNIIDANIILGDALNKKTAAGTDIEFIDWNLDDFKPARNFFYSHLTAEGSLKFIDASFAVIIGNPPYQLDTKGDNKTYAAPIYHKFLESFWRACNRVMMIHPARCLFQAGGTPKDFMRNLLADEHIKVIFYEADSSKIFKNTDIKGGVAVTYRDANKNFGAIGVYIPFPELQTIFQKAVANNADFQPFSKIVYPRADRKLSDKFFADYPDSPLKNNDAIGTNAFTKFPEIFSDDKPNDGREYIQILGRIGVKRVYKWIRRDYVKSLDNLDKYKVFIPSSNGSGAIGEVVSTPLVGLPLVGLPLVGSTETFTGVGAFDSAAEAGACLKYIKTKFARALLGILKVTQHNPSETWRYVPMQDFSADSDVDWSRSVAEIDKYLYKKYNLSQEEINFIETKIKAME